MAELECLTFYPVKLRIGGVLHNGLLEVEHESHSVDDVLLRLAELYAGEVLEHGGCPLA